MVAAPSPEAPRQGLSVTLDRTRPPHVRCWFIRSQPLVSGLPEKSIRGPRQKAHFADQLGLNQGNAREIERGSEAGRCRRRHVERHLRSAKRLERFVQVTQLAAGHAGADAPGVEESPRIVVVGEQ